MIKVIAMRGPAPEGYIEVNTTSRANNEIDRSLSPFHLGPVDLYDDHLSLLFENAWQYSKVYSEMSTKDGPNDLYWVWARTGWNSRWANRYPMGKGRIPRYAWWDGQKLGYIQARKVIYVPLYAKAVLTTPGYKRLEKLVSQGKDIALRDFDGYDHDAMNLSLSEVLNSHERRMGHAFVLKMLLNDDPALKETEYNR